MLNISGPITTKSHLQPPPPDSNNNNNNNNNNTHRDSHHPHLHNYTKKQLAAFVALAPRHMSYARPSPRPPNPPDVVDAPGGQHHPGNEHQGPVQRRKVILVALVLHVPGHEVHRAGSPVGVRVLPYPGALSEGEDHLGFGLVLDVLQRSKTPPAQPRDDAETTRERKIPPVVGWLVGWLGGWLVGWSGQNANTCARENAPARGARAQPLIACAETSRKDGHRRTCILLLSLELVQATSATHMS